jgi:hypothetical protein
MHSTGSPNKITLGRLCHYSSRPMPSLSSPFSPSPSSSPWPLLPFLCSEIREPEGKQASHLKGTGSPDGLKIFLKWMDRCRHKQASRVVFEFLKCLQRLSIEINLFLPVNANLRWLIMLLAQVSQTVCR